MPNFRSSDFLWGVGFGIAGLMLYSGYKARKAASKSS